MKSSIASILLVTSLGALTAGVASADTSVSSAVQDIKTEVYELLGKDTAIVTFEPGSSILSESERKNLAAVVSAVRNDANISLAIVAAWADKEYPATKGQQLGKAERQLAEARVAIVKEALDNLGVKTIETHSMAEQPSWIGKLLNTEDTKVKGEGKVKDANDQLTAEIGRILRDKGGPGKAVVIVRRTGDQTAH